MRLKFYPNHYAFNCIFCTRISKESRVSKCLYLETKLVSHNLDLACYSVIYKWCATLTTAYGMHYTRNTAGNQFVDDTIIYKQCNRHEAKQVYARLCKNTSAWSG